ncbi:hypothetical protein EYF80_059792 [Liparis tanakae]|uniref:Uncharacterized protein n=1 Tax=Liparis tanakae TaxID=230148 RepID=A0A4Z2EMS2_9TELE|nr:hypothetical protein EYF80_059792 [Liparis tanakae]
MFNVVHQGRKYVPVRSSVTEDSPVTVRTLGVTRSPGGAATEPPQATWPPPGAKLRGSKTGKGPAGMKAVRAHLSPPSGASVEGARGRERSPGSREGRSSGGPPRARKRGGFRAPDVRTIFSPEEKDPRVRQESGEGHAFEPGGEDAWCDVCCRYIFQRGVTCAAGMRSDTQTDRLAVKRDVWRTDCRSTASKRRRLITQSHRGHVVIGILF